MTPRGNIFKTGRMQLPWNAKWVGKKANEVQTSALKNKNIMRKELCLLEENLTGILRLDIPSIQEGFNIRKPAHTK